MALNLLESSHEWIRDIIVGKFNNVNIAKAMGYSTGAVRNIRRNLYIFRSTKVLSNGGGQKRSMTPLIMDALREYLQEKPGAY